MTDGQQIQRLNWALSAYARSSTALIRHENFEDLALKICQAIADSGVYCLAFLGLGDASPAKTLTIVARAGDALGYSDGLEISWSEHIEVGRGPAGHAIRTQKPCAVADIRKDPLFSPWLEKAERYGIRSVVAVPFGDPGRTVGVLAVFASEPGAFGDEVIAVFEKLAAEAEFARSIDQERKLFEQAKRDRLHSELLAKQERDFSRAVIDSLPGILYLYDKSGRFLRWNQNFERVSGYSASELQHMRPEHFSHGADQMLIRAKIDETFQRGESSIEAGFLTKDGSTIPYFFKGVTVWIDGQECLVGIGIDITIRKRAEQEAQNAQADLARIARISILGEFAAAISHELNQPLAAIMTNSEASLRWLAHEPANTSEAEQALQRIIRDARRANNIIKQAREALVNVTQRYEPLDLNGIVTEIVSLTSHQCQPNKILAVLELEEQLPRIMGDRTQIQQVLINLVLNAIDAMSASSECSRKLTIRTQRDGPDAVHVQVEDTGPGFDNAIADQLFDRFFTTKQGGIGLGLSISRSIIENHGGRLSARNAAVHGAIFELTLPPVLENMK